MSALAQPADAHTSQNSLDWTGVYEGVLPCADCPGIETRLTLNRDGSYELSTRYLERQDAPLAVRGLFSWNAGGNAIALDAKGSGQQYSVGEGRLALLNHDGTPGGTLSPNPVLTRVSPLVSATHAGVGLVQTLEANQWTLESATAGQNRRIEVLSPGPGRSFVFNFSGSRLNIQGGCNRLTGDYHIDSDGQLKVGRMAATMMACEAAAMQADSVLSELLAKPMKVDLVKGAQPVLRLVSATDEALVLIGQATPEARHGPGSLIFLEVAAQPVACKNPLNADTVCLQVRERHYDKQGLVVGTPEAWRPLYESIEGFTHTVGERNVLRVKRFEGPSAPAGTSPVVYVLDLIIESEIVPR